MADNTSGEDHPLIENHQRNNSDDEITSFEDFKRHIGDFVHFAIQRERCCCNYKHHFITLKPDDNNIIVVHYTNSFFNDYFGIGEVKSEKFTLNEGDLKSLVDFENEKCSLITHDDITKDDNTVREMHLRIIEKMEERFYDLQNNNCEHFVHYVLYGEDRAPYTSQQKCLQAFLLNPIISDIKSFGLPATLIISFIGIALSSIVRQSYVRLFIAMFISFKRQDNFGECTSSFGKSIIDNAKDRILLDEDSYLDEHDKSVLKNISLFFGSPLVCGKAAQLGVEALLKSSLYLLLIWSILQGSFILVYNYLHLKPFRRLCLTRSKMYMYRKYLYKEVFAGYIAIFATVGFGIYFHKTSSHPFIAYFICLCTFALFVRLVLVLFIEFIFLFPSLRGRHDICCAGSFVVLLVFLYIIFIIIHYSIPTKFDPF